MTRKISILCGVLASATVLDWKVRVVSVCNELPHAIARLGGILGLRRREKSSSLEQIFIEHHRMGTVFLKFVDTLKLYFCII